MPADVQISESFLVYPNANHAELPVYDARDNKVLFIDMEPQPAVHSVRLDGSDHQSFALKEAEFCTGIFLTEREGEVLVGGKLNIGLAKLVDGRVQDFKELVSVDALDVPTSDGKAPNWKPVRINESKTDVKGRLWFATCYEGKTNMNGQLYLLDAATKQCTRIDLDVDLIMPNAMVFSPDSKTFFLGCSETGMVWRWDCDLDKGPGQILSNRRNFYAVEKPCVPDGMTIDSEGRLYLAIFNGGRLQILAPDGSPLYSILLPTQSPTCPVFAGPELDQLIITTHAVADDLRKQVLSMGLLSKRVTEEELDAKWPHRDGRLYKLRLEGAQGLPMPKIKLA